MSRATAQERFERAVREHRAALARYLEFARRIAPELWSRPAREGGWSPAEVTEHLALACEAVLRELHGGPAMEPRLGRGSQALLRWFLVPHMLFHRSMPRAAAPRETRPSRTPASAAEGIARLANLGDRLERAFVDTPSPIIDHPYFGPLDRRRALRLAALHIEVHQRRLSSALTVSG